MPLNAERSRVAGRSFISDSRDDNAVATPPAADPHGAANQFFIERDLAARKKTVAVHMENPVHLYFVAADPAARERLIIYDWRFTRHERIADTLVNRKSKIANQSEPLPRCGISCYIFKPSSAAAPC